MFDKKDYMKKYMKQYYKKNKKKILANQKRYDKKAGRAPWAERRQEWIDKNIKPLTFQDYFPSA